MAAELQRLDGIQQAARGGAGVPAELDEVADVESGAVPNDDSLIGPMVKNICYANAKAYLGLAKS